MTSILRSLTVRTAAAFLLGLISLLLIITAAVVVPGNEPAIFRLVSPQEAASIAELMETLPPVQQTLAVQALDGGPRIVRLLPDFPPDVSPRAAGRILSRLRQDYGDALQQRPFRLYSQVSPGLLARGRSPIAIRLLIRLRSGPVLSIERAPIILQRLSARFAAIAAATAVVLFLILLFCWRQMVQPVRRLSKAARQLSTTINAPDLPLAGATEIRTAAIAFNDMKHTIRDLMAERTRVLAAIAHDLRTYLTRLRLRAEFISDPDQQARAARDLAEMSLLLDDTLLFAREEAAVAPPEDADAIELWPEILRTVDLRHEIGERVDISAAAERPLEIRASPVALRRMLANLIDNAIRYGGSAHIHAWQDGDFIWITVDDDGPGVPEDAFGRLVQPFERLEPSRGRGTGGAGLGLAIVKALARSQGGDLLLENRQEGGLRAAVRLRAPKRS
jgi:two-component system osmolarity sensor histidine kinase EnvZ